MLWAYDLYIIISEESLCDHSSYDTDPQFLQSHSKECPFSRILWQARGTWTYSNLDPYEIVTCKNSQDNLVALKDTCKCTITNEKVLITLKPWFTLNSSMTHIVNNDTESFNQVVFTNWCTETIACLFVCLLFYFPLYMNTSTLPMKGCKL